MASSLASHVVSGSSAEDLQGKLNHVLQQISEDKLISVNISSAGSSNSLSFVHTAVVVYKK